MDLNRQYGNDYFSQQLKVKNNPVRRFVRGFYLRNLASHLNGKTLDFGCGSGALLERLDAGSIGIEVNEIAANYCQSQGLDVRNLDFLADQTALDFMCEAGIENIVLNHVLEHFDDPVKILKLILQTAERNLVNRVVIVVPGLAGFKSDATHRTFIKKDFVQSNALDGYAGYGLSKKYFYPVNIEWLDKVFRYHELHMIFDRLKSEDQVPVGKKGK